MFHAWPRSSFVKAGESINGGFKKFRASTNKQSSLRETINIVECVKNLVTVM